MNNTTITAQELPEDRRAGHAGKLFGGRFLWIESFVFDTAASLCEDYDGGTWDFYELSNGGFYISPSQEENFAVACANGFHGALSAQAFGITCCLYGFSLLSFSPDTAFGEQMADHFHRLREFALQHDEARSILAAID